MYINRLAPGMKPEILDPRTTSYLFLMGFEMDESTNQNQIDDVRRVLQDTGAVEIAEKIIEDDQDGAIRQIF